MSYEAALAYLASLEPRGWRLGLDRMQEFARRAGLEGSLGEPAGPQYIHVAGTNGKGSVTAFLQSMMVECGHRTGAFFSPYVIDPRERIQIGRELISKEEFARLATQLKPVAESLSDSEFGGITEFEFKTAVGFACWKAARCEWVALEVGLGGRLDATNIVKPRASVIVSIGLDHTGILGNSLQEIAREKAGIIKERTPVVVGEMPEEAREEVLQVAAEKEAPVWLYGRDITLEKGSSGSLHVATPSSEALELRPSLYGRVQGHNAALAYAAMLMAGAGKGTPLVEGVSRASVPGRFQKLRYGEREVILDGAHNRDAAENLLDNLESDLALGRTIFVTGMVKGHDPSEFYAPLGPLLDSVHVAPIDVPRAAAVETVVEALEPIARRVQSHASPERALTAALQEAGPEDRVVVTGSFYLVGDVARIMSL